MPTHTWKDVERSVAAQLGGQRNPLSGRNGKHTRGDVILGDYYVEVKHRKRIPFYADFLQATQQAVDENKVLLFVFHQKGSSTNIVMVDLDIFASLLSDARAHRQSAAKLML